MNYINEDLVKEIVQKVKGEIPYKPKFEQMIFVEKLKEELDEILSMSGYHIAKYYVENKTQYELRDDSGNVVCINTDLNWVKHSAKLRGLSYNNIKVV